jgi:hypothetical protein
VPRFIEEFLCHEMVAAPFLDMDVPCSQDVGGKVALGHSVVICGSGRSLVGTSVVVEGPTEVQVLLSLPQEPVTRLYSAQVIMTQCISYVMCHGMVVKTLARPPELATLELGPMVPSRWHARLATKGCGGAISPRLLVPHHPLPIKMVPRRQLVHHRSCSSRTLHNSTSSHATLDRCFRVPGKSLWSAWSKVVEALLGHD